MKIIEEIYRLNNGVLEKQYVNNENNIKDENWIQCQCPENLEYCKYQCAKFSLEIWKDGNAINLCCCNKEMRNVIIEDSNLPRGKPRDF